MLSYDYVGVMVAQRRGRRVFIVVLLGVVSNLVACVMRRVIMCEHFVVSAFCCDRFRDYVSDCHVRKCFL